MDLPDIRLFGVYQGTVTSVEDEKQMDRIEVFISALFSGVTIGGLRPITLAPGWSWKPSVNDFVWVMFENGDPERGLYLGSWWPLNKGTQKTTLPEEAKTNYPNTRILTTPAGHKIELDDTEDATKIKTTSAGGHTVELDDTSGSEKVKVASNGGHELELDDTNGSETLTAKHSNGAEIVIDKDGNIKITAIGGKEIQAGGGGSLQKLLNDAAATFFNNHKHGYDNYPGGAGPSPTLSTEPIKPGGLPPSTPGVPDPMTDNEKTAILKAE
jgi:hypothetical protein